MTKYADKKDNLFHEFGAKLLDYDKWGYQSFNEHTENYLTYKGKQMASFFIGRYGEPEFQEYGDFFELPKAREVYMLMSGLQFDLVKLDRSMWE